MKKISILFVLLVFLGTVNSSYAAATRIKIKVKHGRSDDRCGEGCSCPLGICITAGIVYQPGDLTAQETALNFGTAEIDVYGQPTITYDQNNNQIITGFCKITFDQATALQDGTIPLDWNLYVAPAVAQLLGYSSVMINANTYQVDFTQSTYGHIIVSCVFN